MLVKNVCLNDNFKFTEFEPDSEEDILIPTTVVDLQQQSQQKQVLYIFVKHSKLAKKFTHYSQSHSRSE